MEVEARTGGATMARIAGIKLAVSQPFKHRVLTSLNDYYSALFGTILSSLIESTSALMQWDALTRTPQELAAAFSWDVALKCLNRHLPRASTMRRGEFGKHDADIVLALASAQTLSLVTKVRPAAPAVAAAASAAAPRTLHQQTASAPPGGARTKPAPVPTRGGTPKNACSNNNFNDACKTVACGFNHDCCDDVS
jgi:hypothetical protein